MEKKPVAFIKKVGGNTFTLNTDDKKTYSLEEEKRNFPGFFHQRYPVHVFKDKFYDSVYKKESE